jgi:peptidoglycan glycosyltransferase
VDLKMAFAKSCNSTFADMGRDLQTNRMNTLADQLLFNSELPLSFPYNQSSFQLQDTAAEAEKMQTAIGQGSTLVTPMHMAMLFSAIANDGVLMVPRFLERTENYTGSLIEEYALETYGNLMTAEEADTLEDYLRAVVEEGTASALESDQYIAYGKTGTAEYSSDKSKSHAWFAGYVKGSKSDLVVCVLVEEAGSGSEYAVPIARKIFDAYYASGEN